MSKYIVVHSGARDQYKLAETLYKNGKLGYLVTDDILFRKEYRNLFPRKMIKISYLALLVRFFLQLYHWGEKVQQLKNFFLGRTAGILSQKKNMPLLALQEYALHAYKYSDVRPRIVFQYHPHANSFKSILENEIIKNPDSVSFQNELMIYTPHKLKEAAEELKATDYYIAASSFTQRTLVENGAIKENTFVAPYGVITTKYPYIKRQIPQIITFVFVGSFVERKGIFYLLNAAKRLEEDGYNFKLKLTGRYNGDLSAIEGYNIKSIEIRRNLPHEELISLLHTSDVFVFPSLFEGFAFVIIEAMSTGLPVITTHNTAGPDVIRNGEEGFIIEPSNVDAIYDKMKYFILHPECCVEMGKKAADKSKTITWMNFEKKIMEAVNSIESNKL